MIDREGVIRWLKACSSGCEPGCPYEYKNMMNMVECKADLMQDALELLKVQEQEIRRLKHHVDCDAAEKLPSGCVGYGRGFNDDEPCETCKACEKYNGYGEE